jgi:hypothetical protein
MNNAEKANLPFQRKAVEAFHSRQAAVEAQSHAVEADDIPPQAPALFSPATENGSHSNTMEIVETGDEDDMDNADEQPRQRTSILIFITFVSTNHFYSQKAF